MRILQVIPTLNPTAGGPVEGLVQQGMVMTAHGHDVQTVCLDAPGAPVDGRLRSSAAYQLGPSHAKYGFAWRLEPWLRENIRHYDVVIIHGMWTYHSFCTAKVARSLNVPYVVFLHGMLDSWFAKQYPLKHAKKWLYWPWAEYRTLRDAAYVLFTTQEELRLARGSFWLYKVRERMVGYGIRGREQPIGHARPAFAALFPGLADKRNLLYLSRLHPKKGCDLLINAFAAVAAAHPELHLVLAGPGDEGYVSELRRMVQSRGIGDRVTFTGMLSGEVKWGAYDCADAFVLPSHQENFGIVVAEALASKVPVLTTRQVNIWREIEQAEAGLIDVDTQEGANRLIEHWLALPELRRAEMRSNAEACFRQHFHIENVTRNLMHALEDVVAATSSQHTYVGAFLKASEPV